MNLCERVSLVSFPVSIRYIRNPVVPLSTSRPQCCPACDIE